MNEHIHVELLHLADGERRLRLEHTASGLCLEKRLDAGQPVVAQAGRWKQVFTALLARELLAR